MNAISITKISDWASWLNEHEWDLFGTLNFTQNHKPSQERADKLWRRFWNEVDRAVHGKRVNYGERVERMVFVQLGALGDNPHIHFVAKSPIDPAQFSILLNAVWTSVCAESADPKRNEILPIIDQQRALEYALHDHWRMGSDTFCPKLSHIAADDIPQKVRGDAFDRLSSRATNTWLWRANEAYDEHVDLASERFNRRSH